MIQKLWKPLNSINPTIVDNILKTEHSTKSRFDCKKDSPNVYVWPRPGDSLDTELELGKR